MAKKQFTEEEARQRKNERQREYAKRTGYNLNYDKTKRKRYDFDFGIETDKDVIDWLEQQPNKAGYIKQLIREDIQRTQTTAIESDPAGKIDQ